MDFFERLHPALKTEVLRFPEKHYFDLDVLTHKPSQLQMQRLAQVKENPTPKPKTILTEDIFIKSSIDDVPLRLHIYKKQNTTNKNVVIYYHGGGYIYGLPEQCNEFLYRLVDELGITVVAPCYRLVPANPFPKPIQDGYDAFDWLLKNGKQELNVDTNNIALFGASAGGHLAAAVAQKAVDNNIKNISLQLLLYPVITNFLDTNSMNEFENTPFWNKIYAKIAWQHMLGNNVNQSIRYADLFNFDKFEHLPKSIVITCELDPLRDEGLAYAQKLMAAKVSTELWNIPGAMHVFDRYKNPLAEEYYHFVAKRLKEF